MDGVTALLRSFDDAWRHPWESLASAIADLSDEEASWQPPAYASEPQDEGVGRPGTILWALCHLLHCHRHYAAVLRSRPGTQPPETPPPGELPLEGALAALEEATRGLRGEVARIRPEDLTGPCTASLDVAGFLGMVTRHMVWHASQIRLVRRLFAQRGR